MALIQFNQDILSRLKIIVSILDYKRGENTQDYRYNN